MIRLLYLTAEPWPTFRADVASLFGRYLPRQGVHSDLVALGQPGQDAAWGGGQAWLRDPGHHAWQRHAQAFVHGVRGLLRASRGTHDAIQVRDLPLLAAIGLAVARMRGLPFFYWMSYPMPEGHLALARERGLRAGWMRWLFAWLRGRLGGWLLYRVVLPRADHVFVQSDRMRDDLAARALSAARMTPVPMGVDFEAVAEADLNPVDDPRLAGRRPLVYLGTLDRPRRIERLFEMLALVRQKEPAAMLLLAGDCGDEAQREALRRAAAAVGVVDHVIWTGWQSTGDGWRHVRAAEVGLSPIPRGALLDVASPSKVGEYLALGVPVVCNDNPDQAAVIAASGGGLCVDYTAQDFAAAVLSLLALPATERAAMACRGAAWVRAERDYGVIAAGLSARYRGLLGDCACNRGPGGESAA